VVGLNSNAPVRLLKGPQRPIFSQEERAEMLAALGCVDFVVLFDENTAERLVSLLQPDIYVKGVDYAPESDRELPEAEIVRAYGGKVELVPLDCHSFPAG
jgi:rfaE bifunctional protein nucleotidyltransferase chain/domain